MPEYCILLKNLASILHYFAKIFQEVYFSSAKDILVAKVKNKPILLSKSNPMIELTGWQIYFDLTELLL